MFLWSSRFNYGRPGSSIKADQFGGRLSASRKKGGLLRPIERTKTPGVVSFSIVTQLSCIWLECFFL